MSPEPASPNPQPGSALPHHPPLKAEPVVKQPAPKKMATPPLIRVARPKSSPWRRIAEALVFALLAAGAGWYVSQQIFTGDKQEVDKPVGPVSALLNPAVDSGAPAVGK
ncbi:MAG TPA: hypothetical protein VIM58_03120 [Candidatus Methylacidiphilales bacterium]